MGILPLPGAAMRTDGFAVGKWWRVIVLLAAALAMLGLWYAVSRRAPSRSDNPDPAHAEIRKMYRKKDPDRKNHGNTGSLPRPMYAPPSRKPQRLPPFLSNNNPQQIPRDGGKPPLGPYDGKVEGWGRENKHRNINPPGAFQPPWHDPPGGVKPGLPREPPQGSQTGPFPPPKQWGTKQPPPQGQLDGQNQPPKPPPQPSLQDPKPPPQPSLRDPNPPPQPSLRDPKPPPQPSLQDPKPPPQPSLRDPKPPPQPLLQEQQTGAKLGSKESQDNQQDAPPRPLQMGPQGDQKKGWFPSQGSQDRWQDRWQKLQQGNQRDEVPQGGKKGKYQDGGERNESIGVNPSLAQKLGGRTLRKGTPRPVKVVDVTTLNLQGPIPSIVKSAQKTIRVNEKHIQLRKNMNILYREAVPTGLSPIHHVLLLHGAAFCSATWEELGTLQYIAAMGHRAIAVDIPGSAHGKSTGSIASPRFFMSSLLKALNITDPVIISPSMSGSISLPFLVGFPERILGFVAVAPVDTAKYLSKYPEIKTPTLIVYGELDQTLGPESVRNLKNLPNRQLVKLSGAKHPAYLDQPDIWHTVLYNFLERLYQE